MNSIALVVLALAACAHGAAVSGWGGGGVRVAGGEDAQPHEFPHHVSMQTSTLWLIERHICGAAIISPEWVLTAAHCVRSVPWYSSAFILAGRHSLSAKSEEGQQRAAVRAMHVHEKYAKGQTAHDIALLHLKTPLVFSDTVQAAVLPVAGYIPTAGFFMVSGWGQVGENKDGNVLQKTTLPVIPFNKCSAFFQQAGLTTPLVDTEICVGNLQVKGKSTCHGDGGSPLSQWNVGLNAWTVAGVSAFATMPCGAQPTPSVYTRVSAYIDWIQSTMNKV